MTNSDLVRQLYALPHGGMAEASIHQDYTTVVTALLRDGQTEEADKVAQEGIKYLLGTDIPENEVIDRYKSVLAKRIPKAELLERYQSWFVDNLYG